jgi:hypothetical protein
VPVPRRWSTGRGVSLCRVRILLPRSYPHSALIPDRTRRDADGARAARHQLHISSDDTSAICADVDVDDPNASDVERATGHLEHSVQLTRECTCQERLHHHSECRALMRMHEYSVEPNPATLVKQLTVNKTYITSLSMNLRCSPCSAHVCMCESWSIRIRWHMLYATVT